MDKWARVRFQPSLPLEPGRYVTACKEHIALSREVAEEGMVLLKNEGELLPLCEGTKIALFGKGSFDYVKGGGGSGDVATVYVRNLYDGFKALGSAVSVYEPISDFYRENVKEQYANGAKPGMTVEPELTEEQVKGPERLQTLQLLFSADFPVKVGIDQTLSMRKEIIRGS